MPAHRNKRCNPEIVVKLYVTMVSPALQRAPIKCDVAIVGGGLAGLICAIALRKVLPKMEVKVCYISRVRETQYAILTCKTCKHCRHAISADTEAAFSMSKRQT